MPGIPVTVVSLTARPWQSSMLCFEVGGILETLGPALPPGQNLLGTTVTAFPFSTTYSNLNPSSGGDPATLSNSQQIMTIVSAAGTVLASLRAEPRKAALDMAVNVRQNAYFAKYGPTPVTNIVNAANTFFGTGSGSNPGNPAMLTQLAALSTIQANQLATYYTSNNRGWPGYPTTGTPVTIPGGTPVVVQNTLSQLTSKTYTTDSSTGTPNLTTTTTPNLTTTTTGQGSQTEVSKQNTPGGVGVGPGNWPGAPDPTPLTDGDWWTTGTNSPDEAAVSENASSETSTQTGTSTAKETGSETSTGSAYAVETENIVNTDYTYRVPFVESQAQNLRAQISLNGQQFSLLMATQNLSNLSTVLKNELNTIDLNVYQLQVAFMNTLLLPSIDGTVTGVYKFPGDPVRAGDPIIRLEDNSQVLLVARLVYSGPINIAIGATPASTVTITTNLYDSSPSDPLTPPLSGPVIAARGAGDDDLWDIVVQVPNLDPSGNFILPIGYTFDYDNVTVTIS